MSDVVGTAFVKIKALTSGLAKDIEKNIKKGMKDANLDKASEDAGSSAGEAYADGFADSSKKALKKRSKAFDPGDALFGDAKDAFQQLDFDDAFNGVQEKFRQLEFDLPDIDVAPIEKAFKDISTSHKKTVDDIDNSGLSKALDKLQAKFKSLGGGGSFNLGILKSKIGLIGGAIVAALPYIQDVGAAVLAYATGLVAQIGFLGTALGGVGVAAGAALASTALAVVPIMLAFKAETETLLAFKDSMAAAGEEFSRIGVATQQTLLPALDEAVFILGDLVPMFSEFGFFVGRAVGDFAKLAAGVLTGNEAQGRFQDIMQSSLRILDMLLPTLLNIGNILSGIWVAALPAAERFVGTIQNLTDRWADMVVEGLKTGELTEKFDLWYDRAELLGSALGNLSGALGDILSAGANSADNVFIRFDEWAERYRAFTESESGQNKLALIFDNALAVMREVNGIAADLFDGILGRLGDVGGVDSMVEALQRFRDVIPQIQEFWADAYETIKGVVELFASSVWEKITQAWEQMADPLGRLATQLLDLLAVMNDSGAFSVFLDLMEVLTDTLAVMLAIPGFGTFIAYFLAFGTAIKVASIVMSPFLKLFGGFASILITLVKGAAGLQMAGIAGGLAKLAAGFKAVNAAGGATSLLQGLKLGASQAGTFSGAIGGAAAAITGSAGLLAAFSAVAIPAAVLGGIWVKNKIEQQRWNQEIRQTTDALGLLNGGLNITAEGVAKYINETSRFNSKDQIDDLGRLGFSVDTLGKSVADGTLSYKDFAQAALLAGEVSLVRRDSGGGHRVDSNLAEITSLRALASQYKLTTEQVDKLAQGEKISVDGVNLRLEGNDSLLESFNELNKVIGAAAKESIDEFVTNSQNMRLLNKKTLEDIKSDVEESSDEGAADAMAQAQDTLSDAAKKSALAIRGLSDATRAQIREQSTAADGTINWVQEEQLLQDALAKQNRQIRENLRVFNDINFQHNFREAKRAAVDFNTAMADVDFAAFKAAGELGIEELTKNFPEAITAADNLFRTFEGLPEDEFNAAATAIGADAGRLREAMNGAQQAIIDLAEQALSTLPSVGELLDEATSVDDDGNKTFKESEFIKGVNERTKNTIDFGNNIALIKKEISAEAAALAAREGPEAARNLAKLAGTDAEGTKVALASMEQAESDLKTKIDRELGPGIRAQFLASGSVFGDGLGKGVASGLNSPATLEALKGSSLDALNVLAQGFKGQFVIENNVLSFKHTGAFKKTYDGLTPGQRRLLLADGGFVEQSGIAGTFNRSFGTDTVPAMLTPGEFVNTRSTVDRLGVGFFEALNSGSTPVVPVGGSPINASGWTIVAPSPEESARQMISRFRTLSYLSGGG